MGRAEHANNVRLGPFWCFVTGCRVAFVGQPIVHDKKVLSNSQSGVGFRGQLDAGQKFKVAAATVLETFAEAVYFSDVGTAKFATSNTTAIAPSHVSTEDLWELRVGGRLPFGLGSPSP